MKPAPFLSTRPESLDEAVAILNEHGDESRVLAGGQSLVPLLNLRLARPEVIVDMNGIDGLSGIEVTEDTLVIGAMTRQRTTETSPLVAEHCSLLQAALGHVGHIQIRNRGTVGGSIAHADPAAELPAVALALGAEVVMRPR